MLQRFAGFAGLFCLYAYTYARMYAQIKARAYIKRYKSSGEITRQSPVTPQLVLDPAAVDFRSLRAIRVPLAHVRLVATNVCHAFNSRQDASRGHPLAHGASATLAEPKTTRRPANRYFPAIFSKRRQWEPTQSMTEFVFDVRTVLGAIQHDCRPIA